MDDATRSNYMKSAYTLTKESVEPLFCLRAQDITADLVVDFWVKVQQKVREHLAAGLTLEQAVKAVRQYYFIETSVALNDVKLANAVSIAGKMEQWEPRKLAD